MVSPSLAGQLNRGRVLKTLYAGGPLPRPELARLTGSTRATIGQIVQPLLDEGLLEEHEPIASGAQGGKPARPIWFADHGWPVGALLLLPGGAQAALVSAAGRIDASQQVKFRPRKADHPEIIEQLIGMLREVTASARGPLRGIGIAVGGMVDTETGEIVRVDLAPGFNGLGVGAMVGEAFGVPAFVDNQPRAQVLGDLLFGAGRAEDSFCSVYIGEGIGAGYILDGALHRGARGAGGEVGHTTVDRYGEVCRCGLTGCWETIATTRWLRAAAAQRHLPGRRTMDAARLCRLAVTDERAAQMLQEYAVNIGIGLANLQQTLGSGLFVVHGDPVRGTEGFREMVEEATIERSFAHPGGLPRVTFADVDDYAAVRGAAAIVLSRSLNVAF
jgi:predicted NBD/HSP70 family sugar kinase